MCNNVCLLGIEYFELLQILYNFFVRSTARWAQLLEVYKNTSGAKFKCPKSLSVTRWSCRYDASLAVLDSYLPLVSLLQDIKDNVLNNNDTRFQAENILNKLTSPTNHFMMIFWNHILCRLNETNKSL